VIRSACGFSEAEGADGLSDQERQWQSLMASGDPVTSMSTTPQKAIPDVLHRFRRSWFS